MPEAIFYRRPAGGLCGPFRRCRPARPAWSARLLIVAQLPWAQTGPGLVWALPSCRDRLSCWSWSPDPKAGRWRFRDPLQGAEAPWIDLYRTRPLRSAAGTRAKPCPVLYDRGTRALWSGRKAARPESNCSTFCQAPGQRVPDLEPAAGPSHRGLARAAAGGCQRWGGTALRLRRATQARL